MKWLIPGVAVVSAALLSTTTFAQASDPAWLDGLRLQLRADKQCEVQYFLNIQERKGTSGLTQMARAYCEDGRSFDASRTEPKPDFILDECGQNVCELNTTSGEKS